MTILRLLPLLFVGLCVKISLFFAIRPIAVPLNPSRWTAKKAIKIKGRPIVPLNTCFFSRARAQAREFTPNLWDETGQQDGWGWSHG